MSLESDAAALRELLFLKHGCVGLSLYGNDGELACKACGIDFRRDSASDIAARFTELELQAYAKKQLEGK